MRRERRGIKSHAQLLPDHASFAPSLIAADVGIAQADVILMHDRIENGPTALHLSRRARRIIRQNLIVSLGMVAVLVACALAQKIKLSIGVVGHEGSTVAVVLNGLRLLRIKPGHST